MDGQLAKWSNAADCKSVDRRLRRFESFTAHHLRKSPSVFSDWFFSVIVKDIRKHPSSLDKQSHNQSILKFVTQFYLLTKKIHYQPQMLNTKYFFHKQRNTILGILQENYKISTYWNPTLKNSSFSYVSQISEQSKQRSASICQTQKQKL